MPNLILNFICCIVLLVGTACAPLFIGATSASTVLIAQERSIGDAVDDATITVRIKSAFLQKNLDDLFASINVSTTEGRVLLTGSVPSLELRDEAVKIAWGPTGVKEVIEELDIAEKQDKINIKDPAIDSWITAKIQSQLFFNKKIKSVNYNIKTINQVVYLTGVAQNQSELDLVIEIISKIIRVKKINNYVRIKDDYHKEEQ